MRGDVSAEHVCIERAVQDVLVVVGLGLCGHMEEEEPKVGIEHAAARGCGYNVGISETADMCDGF